MSKAPTAHPRFADALAALGLDPVVRGFPDATRTAAQAAEAIGCELSQIVKSLVFEADGEPVLVLMDGASRVDVALVRAELGAETVRRASAGLVRAATGYAIGGVPPFGHVEEMRVLADRGLLAHDEVWAAAGTPHTVFALAPAELIEHARGTLADVREQATGQPEAGRRDTGERGSAARGPGPHGGQGAVPQEARAQDGRDETAGVP
jgi:prolyl-tRNA editing enzyme YbaK/EbsC (Cys-tRNA(Pro) deacylase)